FFFITLLPPPFSSLFPYTTLFRSVLFRLERAVVDRLGLLYFAVGPHADLVCSGQADAQLGKVVYIKHLSILFAAVLSTTDGASIDRKSTRLNSSHVSISYAVFCLK